MKNYSLEKEISKYKVDTLPKELLLEANKKVWRQTNCSHDELFRKSSS
jgi:hypothetical protein